MKIDIKEFKEIKNVKLIIGLVIRRFFGYRYYVVDSETIIEKGFHLGDMGISYRSKVLVGRRWKKAKFTYKSCVKDWDQLLWYLTYEIDRYRVDKWEMPKK